MVSRGRVFDTRFADELEKDTVFSVFRDGRDAVQVITEPERRKNLVGEKSYIVVRVRRLTGREVGEMIFPIMGPVYVRTGDVPRETSKEN